VHSPGLKPALYDSPMVLAARSADWVPGSCRGFIVVAGLADHLVAEDNGDFSFSRAPFDRLKTRLLRGFGVQPPHVVLKAAHEKQQADDGKGPGDNDYQQEYLIRSHIRKCLRP